MIDPTPEQLESTLAGMRDRHRSEPCPAWSVRAARLRSLERLIRDNREALATAIDADFGGRPAEETDAFEIFPSLTEIRDMLHHGRRWMRPRRHFANFWFLPARTELRPQPLGVIGIIVPWNYPLYLTIGPLANALAAGNRSLVKLSESAPRFAGLFDELVERYFPDGEVRVVRGGPETGKAFAALSFDHLLFTGSTVVGREIMRSAAAKLTPVTLELGGKSPAIIAPGADLEHAVERILVGKCINAGQTCIAPDYVLLPRGELQTFIDLARRRFAGMYPDFERNRQYASIIDERHRERLARLRDEAVSRGARIEPLADSDAEQRRLAPALFTGVDPDCGLMRDEIFGPWLPLVAYDTFEEAIEYVRGRPDPLALYLFDDHPERRERILRECPAGGLTFNDTLFHITQPRLPFGGIGTSGMGAYHGEAGFRRFSRMTPVFRQSRLNFAGLLNPPYSRRFRWLVKQLLR